MGKHILSVILLNFAFICIFSIFDEINSIDTKIESLNYIMSNSVDSACQMTMASEELIGDDWDDEVTSKVDTVLQGDYEDALNHRKNYKGATLTYYANGGWYKGNFFGVCKNFDASDNTFSTSSHGFSDSEAIYDWLYTDSSFFDSYYSNVGSDIRTQVYHKVAGDAKYSNDAYKLETVDVPVLDEMGVFDKDINQEENSVSFLKTGKQGKELLFSPNGSGGVASWSHPEVKDDDGTVNIDDTSKYFQTPTSLGLTYLDPRVLKATVASHIETFARCSKNDFKGNNASVGSIPLNVYSGSNQYKASFDDSNTFNTGLVEFDMDSLEVNIDYNVVDRYSSSNDDLIATVMGGTVGADGSHGRANVLEGQDTANSDSKKGDYDKVIVAKVTVGIDVNLPYSTPVMQNFRYLARDNNSDRIGIKPMNFSKGDKDSSVVRYNYITYVTVAR